MVQVLPGDTRMSLLARAIGEGASGVEQNYFRPAYQNQMEYNLNRSRLQNALQSVRGLTGKENVSPFEATAAIMEATAGIPGSERYVGPLLQTLLPQIQAKNVGKVSLTPAQRAEEAREVAQAVQQSRPLPSFAKSAREAQEGGRFFPSNIPGGEYPGQMQEPVTTGQKMPLLTPDQIMSEANRIANQRTAAGIPTTPEQGLELAKLAEDQKKEYNAQVDAETEKRREFQKEYGQKAEEKLSNLMPGATDEMKAYFRKIGEKAATQNKSEADIDRYIAGEVKNFKKTFENMGNKIPAQRLYNMPKQSFLGTDRAFENRRADLRLTLKPLLDKGFYDSARTLLTNKMYQPEEIESILTDLSETATKNIAQMPQIIKQPPLEKWFPGYGPRPYSQNEKDSVRETMENILTKDPRTNLILMRKAMEDKGVDWNLYKDVLNDLINEGLFKLDDDQQYYQLDKLDEPPQDLLDKLLYKLHLRGR